MSCRGFFLGLTDADVRELFSKVEDSSVMMDFANENLYRRCQPEWEVSVDKSWDAMHRCLTDGHLLPDPANPRALCILGVQQFDIYGWIVGLCFPEDVKAVDVAIGTLDQDWLRSKYWDLPKEEYGMFMSEDDFEYTWHYFQEVQQFYHRAAQNGRHTLFIADQ